MPDRRARSAANTARWLARDSRGPDMIGSGFPAATAETNASINPSSPPPWPSAALAPPAADGVTRRVARVRKSWTRIWFPSPSSSPRVPKICVRRPPAALNAVIVNVAVVPPGNSSATT